MLRRALQRFERGSVEELRLENCNSVDYTSLRNLVGLQRLVLMAQPLTSLDFLADCRELRSLDVFAPSKKTDVQQLARTRFPVANWPRPRCGASPPRSAPLRSVG